MALISAILCEACGHCECLTASLCPHQSLQFDQSQLAAVTEENEGLRKQVEQMQGDANK